jgi:hypothetical protein
MNQIFMKKHLLKLNITLVLIVIYSLTFAAHVPPIRTMVIPLAYDNVTFDGAADESFWSALQTTDAFNKTGCSTYPDADFTVAFKVSFDFYYLYVWSEIKDDVANVTPDNGATNPWTFDNVEIFLDLDTIGSGINTAYDSNTISLRFCRGMDSVQDHGRALRSQFKYYWENVSDGWVFEAAIPWNAVLDSAQKEEDIECYLYKAIGFDIHGADSDGASGTPDLRDCQTAWDNDDPSTLEDRTEDGAWNNRSVFGIVSFASWSDCWDGDCPCTVSTKNHPNDEFTLFDLKPDYSGNHLIIENNIAGSTIRIINILGQTRLTAYPDAESIDLNMTNLQQGNIYLVSVTDKQGNTRVKKFFW